MTDGRVDLTFDSRGQEKISAAYDAWIKKQEQQVTATGKQDNAMRGLDRLARDISRRQESAEQRHARLIDEASKAFHNKKISAEEYGQELQSIDQELEQSTGRFKKFSQAQDEAIGDGGGIALLGRYLAAWVSVKTVIDTVNSAVQDYNAELEKAQDFNIAGAQGIGTLKQLAGGDQKRFDELGGLARKFVREGAAVDPSDAAQQVFSIVSSGLEGFSDEFIKFKSSGTITDVSAVASGVAKQITVFGEDAGNAGEIIGKGLEAARIAHASLEEILQKSTTSATQAQRMGISMEENFAALAALTTRTKSVDTSADQLNSFLRKLELAGGDDLNQGSLVDRLAALQKMGLDKRGLVDLFKDQAAVTGSESLMGLMDTISGLTQSIRNVDPNLGDKTAALFDPSDIGRRLNQQRAAEAEANEIRGAIANMRVMLEERAVDQARQGREGLARGAAGANEKFERFVDRFVEFLPDLSGRRGFDNLTPDQRLIEGGNFRNVISPEELQEYQQLKQRLEEQKTIQDNMLQELKTMNSRNVGGLVGVRQ